MRLFVLLPPLLKRLEARRGTIYQYNVYTIYVCTAWIWTEISASRSTGKSVQGQLILITLPDLFDASLEPETGISWEWELGIGLVCRRRWSVPCIQLETANTCWKCRCCCSKKDSPWVNSRAVLPTVTKYENQTGGGGGCFALSLSFFTVFFLFFAFAEA